MVKDNQEQINEADFAKDLKRVGDVGASILGLREPAGFASLTYEADKRYYLNIRGGKTGNFFNIETDDALRNLQSFINKLKNTYPDQYIKKEFLIHTPDNISNIMITSLTSIQKVFESINQTNNTIAYSKVIKYVSDRIEALRRKVDKSVFNVSEHNTFINKIRLVIQSSAFTVKAYLTKTIEDINNDMLNNIYNLQHQANSDVFINDDRIFTVEGKLNIGKWDEFLNSVKDTITNANRRGLAAGLNIYEIISGKIFRDLDVYKYKDEHGNIKTRRDVRGSKINEESIEEETLKKIHDNIIVPLFIKPTTGETPTLLYLTEEQWKSKSKGGLLRKGVEGFGKAFINAGRSIPSSRG